jgi:hypothetical protein
MAKTAFHFMQKQISYAPECLHISPAYLCIVHSPVVGGHRKQFNSEFQEFMQATSVQMKIRLCQRPFAAKFMLLCAKLTSWDIIEFVWTMWVCLLPLETAFQDKSQLAHTERRTSRFVNSETRNNFASTGENRTRFRAESTKFLPLEV